VLERNACDASSFRAALTEVSPLDRDAWVDLAFGIEATAEDSPHLPRGCVPYLPCRVDLLLRVVDLAPVVSSEVFVDVGSGVGRAIAVVSLLTDAPAVGIEVQPELVGAARELAARLRLARASFVEGDAAGLPAPAETGSVFLLYCPFSGERLAGLLRRLEPLARDRPIRVCCVDLPLPDCPWLEPASPPTGELAIYHSVAHRDHHRHIPVPHGSEAADSAAAGRLAHRGAGLGSGLLSVERRRVGRAVGARGGGALLRRG
jgi:SAM-dependent methyltransferase